MKYENTLPKDFDGVFYFSNWTDEDFVGKWNSKEYHFKAHSRSPIIINEESPLQIQWIRKKFAKDLAEREFFKSQKYEAFRKVEGERIDGVVVPKLNSIHQAGQYSINDLAPYIQRCLEPLEIQRASVTESERVNTEEKLSRDEEGQLNTAPLDKKTSLRDKAFQASGRVVL